MSRQTVTLHPGKEGNGTDVYNNTCGTEKISREKNPSVSSKRAVVHQTEFAGGRLPASEWRFFPLQEMMLCRRWCIINVYTVTQLRNFSSINLPMVSQLGSLFWEGNVVTCK